MKLALAAALFLGPLLGPSSGEAVASPSDAESELLFLWLAGRETLLSDSRDAGLGRALGLLDARLAELGQDVGDPAFPSEGLRLANALLAGPACLRIERATEPGAFPLWVQLAFRAKDAETAVQRLEQLGALAARAGVPLERAPKGAPMLAAFTPLGPLTLAAQGEALIVALGEPRPETFAGPTAPAAGPAVGSVPALHARWNGRLAGEVLGPLVRASGSEAERVWRVLEVLGAVGPTAPERSWTLALASDRAVTQTVVSGWAAGGDGSVAVPPLDAADFARIPSDARFARLGQIRPRVWLALARSLESILGENAETGQSASEMLRPTLGADLDELLAMFGPTLGAFTSLSTGGGGFASAVGFVETTDAAGAEALLERMSGLVAGLSAGPAQGRIAVRAADLDGTRVRTVVFPGLPVPLELSFAVRGDALWVALRPDALGAAFEALKSGKTVLDHPRLAPLVAERPVNAVAFGFFDAPPLLERGYGAASTLASAFANALRSPRDPAREPGAIMPPFQALARGTRPSVSWSWVSGDDLVATTSFDRSTVANATVALATPLTSLYGSTVGLGIVSSIAVPKLMTARHSANESAAIASLRSLCSAQAQLQAVGAIDEDRDGQGEYGFLGELTGARPVRGQRARLEPPILSPSFAALLDDGAGGGVVQRSGYWFQVWLPARPGVSVAERADAAAAVKVHPDSAELIWCAYAWPVEPGSTGRRAFYVDQEGDLLVFDNAQGLFGGLKSAGGRQPTFDSARPAAGRRGSDGAVWRSLD